MDLKKPTSLFLNFVIIALTINQVNCLKILGVFPVKSKSHTIMNLSIMKVLAEKGHKVDVYSHFPSKSPIPNYTDYTLTNYPFETKNNFSYDQTLEMKDINVSKYISVYGDRQCKMLNNPEFQKLLKNRLKYDVVITEVLVTQILT